MMTLKAADFLAILESGANNLTNQHREIDALNVFPVPDGDTGTNMNLTFSAGVKEVLSHNSTHVGQLAKVFSRGLLMGARGNSGVILSQIFRGFSQSVADKAELDANDLALAFDNGKKVAYKAVMRPVEGTILTVLRLAAEETLSYVNQSNELSVEDTLNYFITQAEIALNKTPEMLPVLKEVGVVDSGGAGFLVILQGMQSALEGKPIKSEVSKADSSAPVQAQFDHEEFGYCTEFIIQLNDKSVKYFKEKTFVKELEKLGDSLVVVHDEDLVKVHIHTLTPGDALNLGQRYGEFAKLKIENMAQQHEAIVHDSLTQNNDIKKENDYKETTIVSVSAGEGLSDYFKELRVDVCVSGGQTMNPSTEDFVAVINELNCKNVVILPNNSNIVLAAKQVIDLIDDKNVLVLETKSIPEGIAACIAYNPEVDIEENVENMQKAINNTKSGQVTYAIKDTTYDSMPIKAGDYMAISGKKIVLTSPNQEEALISVIDDLVDDESEIITLIVGEDGHLDKVEELAEEFEDKYDVEVEIVEGGQPVYSYMVGVE